MGQKLKNGLGGRLGGSAAPVAVFDANAPPAIVFTRSLGRAGVPAVVYSHKRWPIARFSRYAADHRACPDIEDASAFVPWLTEELRSGRIGLIAPTSDLIVFYMAEVLDLVPEGARRAIPDREAALDAIFKDRFDLACARRGVKTPWSFSPTSIEEALDRAETFPYPLIIKPRSHVGVLERGNVIKNADELRRSYKEVFIGPGMRPVVDRYPLLALPILQSYVPGALAGLFSVSGLLGADGSLIARSASQKMGQWPPALGVGTLFESVFDDALMDAAVTIVRSIIGRGLFELELIRDAATGDLYAIDLNPRAHGVSSLDVARGNDLPLLWYRLATGEDVSPLPPTAEDVTWVHSIPYAAQQLVSALRGPRRAARAARGLLQGMPGRHVDIVMDPADPLSSLAFVGAMLHHPRGLIRSFLRAPAEDLP